MKTTFETATDAFEFLNIDGVATVGIERCGRADYRIFIVQSFGAPAIDRAFYARMEDRKSNRTDARETAKRLARMLQRLDSIKRSTIAALDTD